MGLILAVLGYAFGGFLEGIKNPRRRNPLRKLENAMHRNNQKIDAELAEAEADKNEKIRMIEKEYQEAIINLTDDQQKRKEQYKDDPKKLARWLTSLARSKEDFQ